MNCLVVDDISQQQQKNEKKTQIISTFYRTVLWCIDLKLHLPAEMDMMEEPEQRSKCNESLFEKKNKRKKTKCYELS